ncbi:MAG: isocitrate/isopropylmalate family dehydrogenase [Woeseiaceae bacterium]|nr:isocitrate/isopropylmalate family dehydrogenase [Woeseiaceae bacterium]
MCVLPVSCRESRLRFETVNSGDLDWVIIRAKIVKANTSGHGGRAHRGRPEEVGTEVAIFTRAGVTPIPVDYAYSDGAQARPRKMLTVVTKSNAQRHGMVLWDEIAAEVAEGFPDVTWDQVLLVDAMTARMTLNPGSLGAFVATNLHADILSDLAQRVGRQPGCSGDIKHQPGASIPVNARADPWFCV